MRKWQPSEKQKPVSEQNGALMELKIKFSEQQGGIESALNMPLDEITRCYKKYLNPVALNVMHLLGTTRRFVEAKGIHVKDDQGRIYLDFMSGLGAVNLGHEPPEVLEALRLVEGRPNLFQSAVNPFTAKLAEYLAAVTPGDLCRTFFCNSGAEAVEAALKLARKATARKIFLYTEGAYHGKSFGALSVSGGSKHRNRQPFEPVLPDTESVPFNDLEGLGRRLAREDVAAFIVEPIQGERGVFVPDPGYLKVAEELCRRYGTLLLVDEIQTGMGRTGKLFCSEHEEVKPDILILSKSLGGGVMPIGAIITTAALWRKAYGKFSSAFLHTSTFGGNSRACACGLAAIDTIIRKKLPENAAQMGALLLSGLRRLQAKYSVLREVRGKGLMIGLSLSEFKGKQDLMEGMLTLWVARRLLKRHGIITLFTFSNMNVMRIAPPLIVEQKDVEYFLSAIEDVLQSTEKFNIFKLLKKGT